MHGARRDRPRARSRRRRGRLSRGGTRTARWRRRRAPGRRARRGCGPRRLRAARARSRPSYSPPPRAVTRGRRPAARPRRPAASRSALGDLPNGSSETRPRSWRHLPATAPSSSEGRHRLRRPRVEDLGAVLLRQDQGAAAVDEQRGVPGRQEARRGRGVGVGQRQSRQVDERPARLVAEAAQLHALDGVVHGRRRQAGPVGDVGGRARPEALEVARDQQLEPLGRRRRASRRASPPRPRRRPPAGAPRSRPGGRAPGRATCRCR